MIVIDLIEVILRAGVDWKQSRPGTPRVKAAIGELLSEESPARCVIV